MGSVFIAIIIIILLISFFYSKPDNDEKDQKEKETIAILQNRYRQALKAGDRQLALKYGRDYYAYLRNSRQLSEEDEKAIAEDLKRMG